MAVVLALASLLAGPALSAVVPEGRRATLPNVASSPFSTSEKPNSYEDITTYNNFYEFGTGKDDPFRNAQDFEPRPWSVTVDGHAEKTGTFDFDDFIKPFDLEERIYRMRCVEAWSMVIPWVGISLADIVKHHQPTSKAKYVAFETLYDPKRMPGQRRRVLDWPYREGLTIEEAANPLPILAVGLYGEVLPNQNGAPIRLVVPWKYGFKGIKSVVHGAITHPPEGNMLLGTSGLKNFWCCCGSQVGIAWRELRGLFEHLDGGLPISLVPVGFAKGDVGLGLLWIKL